MSKTSHTLFLISVLLFSLARPALANDADREWQFRVLLDGSPIGEHRFELTENGDSRLVESEATFNVKFLFFNAFSYRHRNTERWDSKCLREIDAETVTNGKEQAVSGEKAGDRFLLAGDAESRELPGCVMTFAYWNPEFLAESRLLNPQTGEYVDVEIAELGTETITVREEERVAQRYRITAKDRDVVVWYSPDDEWLALQSVAKGGRIIRYELI